MTADDLIDSFTAGDQRPSTAAEAALVAARRTAPLRYFVTLTESEMRTRARASDARYAAQAPLGPLDGVPFAIKDNIEVGGELATCGSALFADHRARTTAPVVSRLLDAGAVPVGRTNMHELALGATGDLSVHGAAANPHDPGRMTGGSSSGSAGAVAAGVVPLALGTDTGGSIRIPAALCGVVGMKPTHDLLDTSGVLALSPSFDTVGPLTASVSDNARALDVLTGAPGRYTAGLETGPGTGLASLTVGLPENFYFDGVTGEVAAAVRAAADLLGELGARIRSVTVDAVHAAHRDQRLVLAYEANRLHRTALAERPDAFSTQMYTRMSAGDALGDDEATAALERRAGTAAAFAEVFERVDVLATPTTPFVAPALFERERELDGRTVAVPEELARLTAPSNYLGVPSLALPCGWSSEGLPIGLQLIGPAYSEALLYRVARALEAASTRALDPRIAP